MKKVIILGSTGSIGKQALDVVSKHPDQFELVGISCKHNIGLFKTQILKYHPQCIAGPESWDDGNVFLFPGDEGIAEMAALSEADIIVNGISGFNALKPLIGSLRSGKVVALANKESIVCGKSIIDPLISEYGGMILPVDSEQSAIFQCKEGNPDKEIHKLILTASGGRFWQYKYDDLRGITPEDALHHPTWSMGSKITIDSATLFNKGLEIIEASYLFDVPGERIDVLIHPQSIVHSMVEYIDGTIYADLSVPDMRIPIQYALSYPNRLSCPSERLDLARMNTLQFFDAPLEKYPALRMAYDVLKTGGSMPVIYNAANEIAVENFVSGIISFTDIYDVVEETLSSVPVVFNVDSVEQICEIDRLARIHSLGIIHRRCTES